MKIYKYTTKSGKDVIMDYINNLSEEEQVDALSVLESMENNEMHKVQFKRWENLSYN